VDLFCIPMRPLSHDEVLDVAVDLACRLVNRPVSRHVGIAGPRFTDVGPDRGEAT